MSDTPIPLFAHDEPGPRFSVLEAARKIAEPDEPVEPVANQLRTFVQRKLVQVREKKGTGRTAYNMFAWSDLAAAKVLRTLAQFGVADNDTLQEASVACYFWQGADPRAPGFAHPITAALGRFARGGEAWQFRLDMFVAPKGGTRELIARVYDPAQVTFPTPEDESLLPMGSILVPIYRFAPRILEKTEKAN